MYSSRYLAKQTGNAVFFVFLEVLLLGMQCLCLSQGDFVLNCHLCAGVIQHVAGVPATDSTSLHVLQASGLIVVNANCKVGTILQCNKSSQIFSHLLINTTTKLGHVIHRLSK
jgi:hypothetical protein